MYTYCSTVHSCHNNDNIVRWTYNFQHNVLTSSKHTCLSRCLRAGVDRWILCGRHARTGMLAPTVSKQSPCILETDLGIGVSSYTIALRIFVLYKVFFWTVKVRLYSIMERKNKDIDIRNDRSTFYSVCRVEAGSKWTPTLKVWEQLCDNHSKVRKTVTDSLGYVSVKCPRSSAIPHKSWEKQTWKFQFCYPSFFFFITHNSKTTGYIWMFNMLNESSTTGEMPFLNYSFMQATNSEL